MSSADRDSDEAYWDAPDAPFFRLLGELRQDSDRAGVIVVAAWCDDSLREMLRGRLLPALESRDELLDGDRPLATFSARIALCYRLGLIDAGTRRTFDLLRRLRNECAHSQEPVDLNRAPHSDRVRELIESVAIDGSLWAVMRALSERKPIALEMDGRTGTASGDFRIVGAWVAAMTSMGAAITKRTPEPTPLNLATMWTLTSEIADAARSGKYTLEELGDGVALRMGEAGEQVTFTIRSGEHVPETPEGDGVEPE